MKLLSFILVTFYCLLIILDFSSAIVVVNGGGGGGSGPHSTTVYVLENSDNNDHNAHETGANHSAKPSKQISGNNDDLNTKIITDHTEPLSSSQSSSNSKNKSNVIAHSVVNKSNNRISSTTTTTTTTPPPTTTNGLEQFSNQQSRRLLDDEEVIDLNPSTKPTLNTHQTQPRQQQSAPAPPQPKKQSNNQPIILNLNNNKDSSGSADGKISIQIVKDDNKDENNHSNNEHTDESIQKVSKPASSSSLVKEKGPTTIRIIISDGKGNPQTIEVIQNNDPEAVTKEEEEQRKPAKIPNKPQQTTTENYPNLYSTPPTNTSHPKVLYPLNEKNCGEQSSSQLEKTKIVNGDKSNPDDFLWMAAILSSHPSDEVRPFCGGSLITRRHVLTAAHCLENRAPRDILVRLGSYDFDEASTGSTLSADYAIDQFRIPTSYNKKTKESDIAILRLKTPLTLEESYKTVCMPQNTQSTYVNALATVIGYGTTSENVKKTSPTLRQVTIPIWENRRCSAVYKKNLTNSYLCAGYEEGGSDSCQGDSGGPLMVWGPNERMQVVGVVSFGIGCGQKFPGIYTRVTQYLDWITRNTKE